MKHSILSNCCQFKVSTLLSTTFRFVSNRSRTSFEYIVKTINCLHPIPLSRSPYLIAQVAMNLLLYLFEPKGSTYISELLSFIIAVDTLDFIPKANLLFDVNL